MKILMGAIGVCMLFTIVAQAQTDEDALRYSMIAPGGTARSMGVGGAFGAIGADFGALSINPAGVALFHKSELTFSPSVTGITVKSNFIGEESTEQKYNFNISNFGLVITNDLTKKNANSKWKTFNMAFGANRMNNFNNRTYYHGFNENNSLVDYYLEEVNAGTGTLPSEVTNTYPFSSALVWEAYLINPAVADSNNYESVIPNGQVDQSRVMETKGSNTEYLFSFGGNYDDRLSIGASFGMPSLNYKYHSSYVEEDVNDAIPDFQTYTLDDYITTTGIGFNGKLGLIYRVNDFLRLGGAFHSPTYYLLSDAYKSTIESSFDSQSHNYETPDGTYNYDLITPWRVEANAAVVLKNLGFISLDYEWLDYRQMNFHFQRFSSTEEINIESGLNETINEKYTSASNIRLGAEFMYDVFRFRAGAAYNGSPFAKGIEATGYDFSRLTFTGGLGVRVNDIFIDAAYVHTSADEFYQPYLLHGQDVPGVGLKKNVGSVVMTMGVKF